MRKTYIEECRSIRARDLAASDAVQEALADGAEGLFGVKLPGGERVAMEVGGKHNPQPLFLCPGCVHHARVLYQTPVDPRWRCEKCHDLVYQIRHEHERRLPAGKFRADVRPERRMKRRHT